MFSLLLIRNVFNTISKLIAIKSISLESRDKEWGKGCHIGRDGY